MTVGDLMKELESTIVAARLMGYKTFCLSGKVWFSDKDQRTIGVGYKAKTNMYKLYNRRGDGKVHSFYTIAELEKKLVELL